MNKISRTNHLLIVTLIATLLGLAGVAFAAHNGNNRAELMGDASGRAVVNYSEGQGTFNGTAQVRGLAPGDYTFRVTLNGGNVTTVCSFTVSENSSQGGCSAQGLNLPGFNTAEIVDSSSMVVASGVFDRAGNCRDPNQAGSLCEAPGQHRR